MTTSLSSPENSAISSQEVELPAPPVNFTTYRIKHTLASRFAFLLVCLAIILSALAYGTVHYWALAIFFVGAVVMLVLWVVDSWNLGTVRINRNILQVAIAGNVSAGNCPTSAFAESGNGVGLVSTVC